MLREKIWSFQDPIRDPVLSIIINFFPFLSIIIDNFTSFYLYTCFLIILCKNTYQKKFINKLLLDSRKVQKAVYWRTICTLNFDYRQNSLEKRNIKRNSSSLNSIGAPDPDLQSKIRISKTSLQHDPDHKKSAP